MTFGNAMWCRMILLVVLPVIWIVLDGGRAPQLSQSMIQGNSADGTASAAPSNAS